jgi:protein-tyrosine phosphatase
MIWPEPAASDHMKAELFWIPGPWRGRLAIMPRPRGDDWLAEEVRSWHAQGVHAVVSLLTSEEIAELGLAEEERLCAENGITYVALPIVDRGLPSSSHAVAELIKRLEGILTEGQGVAIHCRQGVGRSAVLTACLLTATGIDSETAFARVRTARGCPVPDTSEQRAWVERFAREFGTKKHQPSRVKHG